MPEHTAKPAPDADVIAFAQKSFGYARVGQCEALGDLPGQGMPANLLNNKADGLLMLAAYHGHEAAVRVLVARGGDTELANDRGQVPLGAAAFKGSAGVVQALLEGGAKIDGAGPDGHTALIISAMFDRTALVELLLSQGADTAARDAIGMSALDLAEKLGASRTPDLLRKALGEGVPEVSIRN